MSGTQRVIGHKVSLLDREGVLVWCNHCAEVRKIGTFKFQIPTPIYWGEIFPSSQDCHVCGCLIVKPEASWYEDMYPHPFQLSQLESL
jgi:hypothetical protein